MREGESSETVHATCVLLGERALLLRGPSGAGKSALALALLAAPGPPAFRRLVADDRVRLAVLGGRLVARPHPLVAGRIEARGHALLARPHEPAAAVGLIVDLLAGEGERLPALSRAVLLGVDLPRLALGPGAAARAAALVADLAALAEGSTAPAPEGTPAPEGPT